jgi:glycine betaine/proline transport system substrate-binding protein
MRLRRIRTGLAITAVAALALAACDEAPDPADDPDDTDEEAVDGEPWTLIESSTPAMLQELGSAIDNEEPIVVTLWHPHWAYDAWDLKDLEDPEGALGEAEEIHSIARPGFDEDHPEATEWLGNFELSADEIAELSTMVIGVESDDLDSEFSTEIEAAEAWYEENSDVVEGWLGDDFGTEVGGGEEIEIAFIPWDEAIAVTNLWDVILTDHGYEVTQTQADVAPVFDGVASGEFDLFLDYWLPGTHAEYQEQFGDEFIDLGIWFDDAALTWTVPAYVDEVDSIADLMEHRDLFGGEIIGIESGAGLTDISINEVMPAYGLD